MDYIVHLGTLIAIYSILAVSLNLIVGYTGLLSVTHAAFYGIGAYASTLLMVSSGMNFFLAMLLGIACTALCALGIGIVLSRFDGDYFALVSFGFNIIVYSIMLNWSSVTRGPLGIPGIPRPELFGFSFSDNFLFFLLALVFLVLVVGVSWWITASSFGRILKAIREDEGAIQAFGYNTLYYKLAIFMVGAGMASVAGSLYASYVTFIDPSTFTLFESIFILSLVILGGLATHEGAFLGALILVLLPEFLRFVGFPSDIAGQMRQLVYGVLLVLLMMYRPQGLIGEYKI